MKKFEGVIKNIVGGFDVKKGDIVLLHFWGENEELHILDKFSIEVAKKGAFPMRHQQSRNFIKEYYENTPDEYLQFPEEYYSIFKMANVVIDICMYTPPMPHPEFPKEKMNFYRENMMKLFSHVTEDKKYFIQVKVPTKENAMAAGIEQEKLMDAVVNAVKVDYSKLREECMENIEKFKGKKRVELIFEDETFSFSIEGRDWFEDCGNGDIPPGEIYVAPIEESGDGVVVIPKLNFRGDIYKDVKLTFEGGKLTDSTNKELLEEIKGCPGDGDMLAEFGIGLNDNIKEMIGYDSYDEKIKGTVHIAVGMNQMFGGKNSAPMHKDFILKPKEIKVDGEIIEI